jgi:hypothetical protein
MEYVGMSDTAPASEGQQGREEKWIKSPSPLDLKDMGQNTASGTDRRQRGANAFGGTKKNRRMTLSLLT